MTYRYKKRNINKNSTQTTSSRTDFLYKPVFLLRNLSPDSIITYPFLFISFSYSFLLVSCWWLSYSHRHFLPPWEYHNIHTTLADPDPEVRSSGTLQWSSMYPSARPELQNSICYCSCSLSEMFYDLQNPRFFCSPGMSLKPIKMGLCPKTRTNGTRRRAGSVWYTVWHEQASP